MLVLPTSQFLEKISIRIFTTNKINKYNISMYYASHARMHVHMMHACVVRGCVCVRPMNGGKSRRGEVEHKHKCGGEPLSDRASIS